jgi:hypothetical protein
MEGGMSGIMAEINFCEKCKWLKYRPGKQYEDCSKCTFAAGRAEGKREAVEAVQGLFKHKFSGHFTEDEVIAAIKAQEGK